MKRLQSTAAFVIMAAMTSGMVIMSPAQALAATDTDTVVYDLNQLPTFKDRTKESVGQRYAQGLYAGETFDNSDYSTYYKIPASTQAPYCEGELTEDAVKAMQGLTDYYRWLCGVNELTSPSVPSQYLQYQALDRNFEYNHWISDSSKPDDMDQELWDKGKACNHNILAWYNSPQGSIRSWINEGYYQKYQEWDTTGHRTALIGSGHSEIQFGFVSHVALGDNTKEGNSGPKEAVYAFPAPGPMPTNLIYPSCSVWSVYFDTSKIKVPDVDAAKVTITHLSDGEIYTRDSGSDTLHGYTSYLNFVQPDCSTSRYSGDYKIEVTGLQDVATGKSAKVEYVVSFFDESGYTPSYLVSAGCDFNTFVVYKTLGDETSLKKIGAALPDEILVTAQTGYKTTIPASGKWTLDMENHCWHNSADASDLPSLLNDKNNILSDIRVYYEISDDYYDQYNSFYISPNNLNAGDSCKMTIHKTNVSTDSSRIFHIRKEGNEYVGCGSYDSNSSALFDKENSTSEYHYYNLTNAQWNDRGEYFSVYYYTDPSWGGEAYVSTTIRTLTVNMPLTNISTINSDRLTLTSRVSINGAAEGGSGEYTYSYYYKRSGSKTWKTIGAENTTAAQAKFTPTAVGDFEIKVDIKDSAGTKESKQFNVTIVDGKSTAFKNNSTVNVTGAKPGTKIKLTGAAEGSSGYRYAFYYKRTTAKQWYVVGTEFTDKNTAQFTPKTEGEFNVKVDVMDKNGEIVTRQFAVSISNDYSVATTAVNKSTISTNSAPAGTKIKVTGAASGGTAPYTYAFYYKKAAANNWTTMGTPFGADTSRSVTLKNTGDYIFKVCVKDAKGGMVSKNFDVTIY